MTRWVEALALLLLAWAVAVPMTTRFARARRPAHEPVAALLTWQAIGLCGGLAVLTAELTLAATGHAGPWRDAVRHVLAAPGSAGAIGVLGLVLFGLSVAWLIAVLIGSFVRAARSRREHRVLLELLSHPDRTADDHRFHVVESAAPLAYALPGRTAHVVVTSAARTQLADTELAAVLAHEQAHLRQRHSLLVQPFVAWERSLPGLAPARAARRRVEELVELVCDAAAVHAVGPEPLRAALDTLLPPGPARVERIGQVGRAADPRQRALLLLAAVVLVVLPPAVLLALPA
ncbi:MAG: M56 family metallopeptidase [Actinobacteria bacterium]|nr:M56 family metallopeptidase [Actinomycetota bacterium]